MAGAGTLERMEWPTGDTRNLAAYLLVNRGIAVPRERLLGDVWPGVEAWEANIRLQVALYRIRQAMGAGYPPVDPEMEAQGAYRWEGTGCPIDAEEFRKKLELARQRLGSQHGALLPDDVLSLMESAAGLYRGEFLDGFPFEWCVLQREDLRAQLLWTTRLLIDHHMALRNWRSAIAYGLQSLRSDPLQEDVVRDLMLCYFRIGDRSSVLQQYSEVKRLLAKLRGVWPSEDTRNLRVKLLGR